jgi:O-antigen ligase
VRLDFGPLARIPLVAILLYFASGLEQYVYAAFGVPPLYAQLVAFMTMVASLLLLTVLLNGRNLAMQSSEALLYSLLLVYIFWTAVSFLYSPQNQIVVDEFVDRMKAAIFMLLFALLLRDAFIRGPFAWGCVPLAMLGAVLSIADFITPTFSTVEGRGAGLYLNPNEAGTMLIALGLIGTTRLKPVFNYLLWSIVSGGVLLTFSRAAWLLLFGALAGITAQGRLGGGRMRFVFLLVVGAVIAGVFAAYLSGDLYVWVSRSVLGQYLDPNTIARLGSRGLEIDDYSSIEREDVLRFGMKAFFESPFLGWGVGYTFSWGEEASTHNMLVLLAAELGFLGPLLYLGMFAVLLVKHRGVLRILTAMMFLSGLFTHNQLDTMSDVLVIAYLFGSLAMLKENPTWTRGAVPRGGITPARLSQASAP